ncbi:MAG: hypothetical protein ACOYJJ_00635 [Anaerovoracaceae bacterium]|jgi:hypothetical protein
MRIKKAAVIIMAAALAFWGVSCGSSSQSQTDEQTLADKIETKLSAYQTDLADSSAIRQSNADVSSYVADWAKNKGISYDKVGKTIIMKVESSKKYKKTPKTVIICPYDSAQFQNYESAITSALYLAKNNENTGKLYVIFTPMPGRDLSAVRQIPSKYLSGSDTRIFILNGGQKAQYAISTAQGSNYEFTQKINRTKPQYKNTYKISYTGLPGGILNSDVSEQTNPLIVMTDLLTSLKNRGISYEIASLHGGNIGNYYPDSASMTITIDPDDVEAFTEYMDKQVENRTERNQEINDDDPPVFKYKAVKDRPSSVLTKRSAERFVSYMYTTLNGTYSPDEETTDQSTSEDTVSVTCVTRIVVGSSTIRIYSAASSTDKDILNDIDHGERTLAGLSGLTYRKTASIPAWKGNSDEDFQTAVTDAYHSFNSKDATLAESPSPSCAYYIQQKNKKADMVSLTVTESTINETTGMLVQFLIDSLPDDSGNN